MGRASLPGHITTDTVRLLDHLASSLRYVLRRGARVGSLPLSNRELLQVLEAYDIQCADVCRVQAQPRGRDVSIVPSIRSQPDPPLVLLLNILGYPRIARIALRRIERLLPSIDTQTPLLACFQADLLPEVIARLGREV